MPTIGNIELQAVKDVEAKTETSVYELFTWPERIKQFTVDQNVTSDQTKLKTIIAKFGTLEIIPDRTVMKDKTTSLNELLKWPDMLKRVKVSDSIKKGESLAITIAS